MRNVNEERIQKTLEFILEFQKRECRAPTYRQIQTECGYSSLSVVAADVARLKERHLIESSTEGGWIVRVVTSHIGSRNSRKINVTPYLPTGYVRCRGYNHD